MTTDATKFAATKPPSSATVAISKSLADKLAVTLLVACDVQRAIAENLIENLRAGRFEAHAIAVADMGGAQRRILDAMRPITQASETVRQLDPAFYDSMQAAIVESTIRLTVFNLHGLTRTQLEETLRIHRSQGCGGCAIEEAIRRAIAGAQP